MTRAALSYRDAAQPARTFEGFDPDKPVAGLYRMRLVAGGIAVGVRIWHGAPLDPVTAEELDRGHRWQATANGEPMLIERAWPKCADTPIEQAEYDHLCALQSWAREAAPTSAVANPTRRLSPLNSPLMF